MSTYLFLWCFWYFNVHNNLGTAPYVYIESMVQTFSEISP